MPQHINILRSSVQPACPVLVPGPCQDGYGWVAITAALPFNRLTI